MMKIEKLRLSNCHLADDLVVVIDVIRAFTTAACAFAQGVEMIILVGTVEEAFETHAQLPGSRIMGEVGGAPVNGFHFSNSPVEILKHTLRGKTLIQRTSSGTQGVVLAKNAKMTLASSFVVAESTYRRILELQPNKVSFVISGTLMGGEEDFALADYLEEKLKGNQVDPAVYLNRVLSSRSGQAFLSGQYPHLPKHDLDIVTDLDRYGFAMQVHREGAYHVLKPRAV